MYWGPRFRREWRGPRPYWGWRRPFWGPMWGMWGPPMWRPYWRRRFGGGYLPGCLLSMFACVIVLFGVLLFMANSIHVFW